MYHGRESKKKVNPKENANIFSQITFLFIFDLLRSGYKKDIEEEDVYEVIHEFKSSKQGDKLEKEWLNLKSKKGVFSIFRLLWACYGRYYLFWGCIQLVVKIVMVMVQPRAVGKLVSYFTTNSQLTKSDAIFYAALVIGLNIVTCTYAHNYQLILNELGIRVRAAFCSLIYRKSLKLSPSSLSDVTVGKIVTLMSKDVNSFDAAIIFLNDMWISLILLVITASLIYSRLGVAALAGILFLVIIIPLLVGIGQLTSNLRVKAAKITDRRIQVTQEALSAIKIIKMYTWEKFFGDNISKVREQEMKKIKQIFFTKATSLVVGGLVTHITLYIIVMVYMALGNNFTAELAFFLMSCLQILRSSVTISIPIGIAMSAELVAAARRIHKVLTAEEQTTQKIDNTSLKPLIQLKEVAVNIRNKSILRNINLKIDSGFTFITGRVGAGKSTLMKTILHYYPTCHGELNIQGTIAYASEEPWLFPSSIKQNILFGHKFDGERYRKVLHVCALEMDLDNFEKGDETIVEDRGMNLSKGQQARINLARAVYSNSDIYLLDDCLSALDTHVQEFVFKECLLNFLKDKIVVMISHNENQIKEADGIVIMENGTIKSCTKPSEIPEDEIEEIVREEEKAEDDLIDDIEMESDEEIQEDSTLLKADQHTNIYREIKKEGGVELNAYKKYYRFGGGIFVLCFILTLFVVSQVGMSFSDKLVSSKWVVIQQNISEYKTFNLTNTTKYEELLIKNQQVIGIYSVTIILSTILVLARAYAHFSFSGKASICLHNSMISAVLKATMQFFDQHYIGNILNRFAKDLGIVDEYLPLILYENMSALCALIGIIVLIATVNVIFLLPAAVIFTIMFFVRSFYLPTGRSLKRLESATRSPVIGHLNATLEGLTTIRAYGTEEILRREFDKHLDLYTSTFHMLQCALRAFAYSLDMLCQLFIDVIILSFLIFESDTHAGNVGLAITQAFRLTALLQWGVRQSAELENQMTSVERVLEYTDVEEENKTGQVLDDWPKQGKISYKDVNLTYGNSKEYVLKNINFTINSREKIGMVGRTGAGKSSLISALFRLYQCEGTITIDDTDIKSLSLNFLRSNIAIIPQDPTLFTGTLRSNIDPIGRYKDEEIWKAIETAKLKELVPSLDYQIINGGSDFSSGQRQLICLARAIISKSKIIILDEATSNMDPESDVLIYTTIQESFAKCTVVTIAHRLHSVLYSDKVMVVDKGRIVEFDDPNELLNNENGVFYKMIKQANLLK